MGAAELACGEGDRLGGRPGGCRRRRPGDPSGPGDLVSAAEDALGPVDILVSNAGMGGTKTLAEVTAADFDAMLAVNLRAPFLLAQRTLPGMADRGFGRILFMSSVAACTGGIVGPHDASSKAG